MTLNFVFVTILHPGHRRGNRGLQRDRIRCQQLDPSFMVVFQGATQFLLASPDGPAASRINSHLTSRQIPPECRTVPSSVPLQQQALRALELRVTVERGTSDLLDNQPVECGQKKRWTPQVSRPPLSSRCVSLHLRGTPF